MGKRMSKGRPNLTPTVKRARALGRDGELETKFYKLEKLVKWQRVDEVNDMLLSGISPNKVSEWCKEQGFDISRPKLYEYKALLQEAAYKKITVEKILGIGAPANPNGLLERMGLTTKATQLVRNELDVLDLFIQRGFDVAATNPDIKISDAIKAIDLKNKITQGAHGGLTSYGLDQLREVERHKFEAVMTVIRRYVPEQHWEELELKVNEAERKYYEEYAPELLEEYERTMQEAMNSDEEIVSDTEW